MKFRTYDPNNPPKEKVYGLFMEDIAVETVNADLENSDTGDYFYSEGEVCRGMVLLLDENNENIFKLFTNDARHYVTQEDLNQRFLRVSDYEES